MKIKALSIKPPWIELILSGRKIIEVRSWKTNYRGPLLLVSSKSLDPYGASRFPYSDNLLPALRGHAVGVCWLGECSMMTSCHEWKALCDYYHGLYSWFLRGVKPIKPFPVRGRLRLFEVEVADD
jgi:hypothetical protein